MVGVRAVGTGTDQRASLSGSSRVTIHVIDFQHDGSSPWQHLEQWWRAIHKKWHAFQDSPAQGCGLSKSMWKSPGQNSGFGRGKKHY